MVTSDRPGGIHAPMSVAEVERIASIPTERLPPAPPLHAGTPYRKGPPSLQPPRDYPTDEDYLQYVRDMEGLRPGQIIATDAPPTPEVANPKTLVGRTKVPMLSVIPATALVKLARALQYGAFHAPRKDREEPGYGPLNWRDQKIEYMTYIDAAMRHLLAAADGEDIDPDTGALACEHLDLAMATLAILIDARMQGTCVDDRRTLPLTRGEVGAMLRRMREVL